MPFPNSVFIVIVCVDWVIVMAGIFGNILVIISILKHKCIKNPVTRVLFTNLAINDLGVLIVRHTFGAVQLYLKGRWIFGEFSCKAVSPVSRSFVTVSIITLVAISYHRYNGIVRALQPKIPVKKCVLTVVAMWLTTLATHSALDIPFRHLNETTRLCRDTLSPKKYMASLISEKAFYVLCCISIFYMFAKMTKALKGSLRLQQNSNIKRRISHSVKTLQILKPTVFVLCMTLFPAWLLHAISEIWREDLSEERYLLYHIIGILMIINSSANPFIYVMASRSFQDSFRRMLCHVPNKLTGKEGTPQQDWKDEDQILENDDHQLE